jgi:hypothetical protein
VCYQSAYTDKEGREWGVASGLTDDPCVLIPISTLQQIVNPSELYEIATGLIHKAKLAAALDNAGFFDHEDRESISRNFTLESIQSYIESLKPFLDEPMSKKETLSIHQAFSRLSQSEAIALERLAQKKTPSPKTKTQATRGKLASNYNAIFIQLGRRDGFHCQHCGTTTDLQIDHIDPVCNGGTNNLVNLQLLCGKCNRLKGSALTE